MRSLLDSALLVKMILQKWTQVAFYQLRLHPLQFLHQARMALHPRASRLTLSQKLTLTKRKSPRPSRVLGLSHQLVVLEHALVLPVDLLNVVAALVLVRTDADHGLALIDTTQDPEVHHTTLVQDHALVLMTGPALVHTTAALDLGLDLVKVEGEGLQIITGEAPGHQIVTDDMITVVMPTAIQGSVEHITDHVSKATRVLEVAMCQEAEVIIQEVADLSFREVEAEEDHVISTTIIGLEVGTVLNITGGTVAVEIGPVRGAMMTVTETEMAQKERETGIEKGQGEMMIVRARNPKGKERLR